MQPSLEKPTTTDLKSGVHLVPYDKSSGPIIRKSTQCDSVDVRTTAISQVWTKKPSTAATMQALAVVAKLLLLLLGTSPSSAQEEDTNPDQSDTAFSLVTCVIAWSLDVKYPFFHSLLWSATGVLFWGWLAVYITEIIKIYEWHRHTPDTREVAVTIIWLLIMVSGAAFASLIISFQIKIKIDLLHPSHAIWGGICGCRGDIVVYACLCKYLRCEGGIFKSIHDCLRGNTYAKKVVGALPLLIIFLWIGYIALNAVPVLLYFVLYPTRVICLYTYVVAGLTFLIFVITEGDYERRITKKQNENVGFKSWMKHHMMYTSIFGVVFLGITTVIFIVTYHRWFDRKCTLQYLPSPHPCTTARCNVGLDREETEETLPT